MRVLNATCMRRWLAASPLALLVGCLGSGGGGGDADGSIDHAPVRLVTSMTLVGTSSESCTVTGLAERAGSPPATVTDSDARATVWSLSSGVVGDGYDLTITGVDRAGNQRVYSAAVER